MFEFHVSRLARDTYHFDESLFVFDGRVIFADFRAARLFAQKINAERPPERAVRAGEVNALGLLDEYRHAILQAFRKSKNPRVLGDALDNLSGRFDPEAVRGTLRRFLHDFPPIAVYKNLVTVDAYLDTTTFLPHTEAALEEMLFLRLANLNPAADPLKELFDDKSISEETIYLKIISGLREFFDSQPLFGPDQQNLIDLLIAPVLASPHSLKGQLDFIRTRWSPILGDRLPRILSALDLLREEEKPAGAGPGPAVVPVFGPGSQAASLALFGLSRGDGTAASAASSGAASPRPPDPEPEQFSLDLDWMPKLVLIAKNSHVWLDQLSRKYSRDIRHLDRIPDEELDFFRDAGITGLWLIGVWERSRASRRIKQMTGNPEAVASAYSLFDYSIAADLGGEPALQNLKERAGRRGIRLVSDMVPNHMGIDSRWVIEHPDWFISLPEPPFPAYQFNGPDLSWDERVAIRIEDRYYDRADAAVVFQRIDKWTGDIRYIYHGNDGTSFPWNDTAQLDYLKPEVREAVIQTILHVARLFPVIRFDAAMTLAKRHLQRLWYPEPGTGGAIPSRAEHALTREEFDKAIPGEFWREVVDRVAAEAPDTLLLAEAFWLLEGYFVRTLGMHRVYNSAFMNMLRDEDNAKYRRVIKNTLEFDPEVLKRYVNFMSNPDERTAIDQFGDGDKYFGVCTLLATLPGLPMVGHGQVEGFTEKYGMEYCRAYYDESPKVGLVDRHRREIFPLFHKRGLFADVSNFLLYDFFEPNGKVDENVFAYSNGADGERALVVFHNKYAETRGWIRFSAAYAQKTGEGDEKILVRKTLAEGLNLPVDPTAWVLFKDDISGLEYVRNSRELSEKGLSLELAAYKFAVYTDFRRVRDDERRLYSRIAAELAGKGVAGLEQAAHHLWLKPVHTTFSELVNPGFFEWLMAGRIVKHNANINPEIGKQIGEKTRHLADAADYVTGRKPGIDAGSRNEIPAGGIPPEPPMMPPAQNRENGEQKAADFPAAVRRDFEAILRLPVIADRVRKSDSKTFRDALAYLKSGLTEAASPKKATKKRTKAKPCASRFASAIDPRTAWYSLFCWATVRSLGRLDDGRNAARLIDEWRLDRILSEALGASGFDETARADVLGIVRALAGYPDGIDPDLSADQNAVRLAEALFKNAEFRQALHINEYQGIEYFNQEAFDTLRWLLVATAAVEALGKAGSPRRTARMISRAFAVSDRLRKAERKSGFETARLVSVL